MTHSPHPDSAAWTQRIIMVPLFFALASVFIVAAPLLLGLAGLVDLARGRRWATARFVAFVGVYLLAECAGVVAVVAIWGVRWVAGWDVDTFRRANFMLQTWWTSSQLAAARVIFGMTFQVEGAEHAAQAPYLLLMRHASLADTAVPGALIAAPYAVRLRYVLKKELLWDPCLNIVGLRLINYFVDRDSKEGEREIAGVVGLLEGLGPDEGVLIYPEGTRFTPAKQRRALEKLSSTDPDLYARASSLTHVLPPRLGGVLGLLAHNPGLPVVFCAHRGFEGAATLGDLWNGSLIGRTVYVEFWRIPYEEIPTTRDGQVAWIFEQWRRVDDVAAHRPVALGMGR